jgi:hypothetical protein
MKLDGSESIQEVLAGLEADYLAVVAHLTPGTFDDKSISPKVNKARFQEICRREIVSFKKPELDIDFDLSEIPNFKYGFAARTDSDLVMTLVYRDGRVTPLVKVSTYEPIQNSLVIKDAQDLVSLSGGNSCITSAGVSPDDTKFEVSLAYNTFEIDVFGHKTQIRQIAKLWTSHDTSHAYNFAFSLIDSASSSILFWNLETIKHLPDLKKHMAEVNTNLNQHKAKVDHFIQEIQVLASIPILQVSTVFVEILDLAVPHEKSFEKLTWKRAWLQRKITEKFTSYAVAEGENAWVLYKACNEFLLERAKASNNLEDVDIAVLKNPNFKKQIEIKERLFRLLPDKN